MSLLTATLAFCFASAVEIPDFCRVVFLEPNGAPTRQGFRTGRPEQVMPFGAGNLSACRKQHGLTQLQLAELLHYSDKAVSKWERGESMPDLAVMKQLADFYGMSIDDFLLTPEQRAEKTSASLRRLYNSLS